MINLLDEYVLDLVLMKLGMDFYLLFSSSNDFERGTAGQGGKLGGLNGTGSNSGNSGKVILF